MRIIFLLFFSLLVYSPTERLFGQEIPVVNFTELEPLLHKNNDTIYLINFWATWCVPCIKELPALEKVAEKYHYEKFKILLISLDMPKQLNSRLIPFIQKHQIKSKVILLNDPDFNRWIDKVDPDWSGAIPASLIYSATHRSFYEQSFEYQELENIVEPLIHSK